MRRMSSLPVLGQCGMSDQLGRGVETSNSLRSTIFHRYCEVGIWPDAINQLSEQDAAEIRRWKVPTKMVITDRDTKVTLEYKDAEKEVILGLDSNLDFVELDSGLSQDELENIPNLLLSGHMDMGWDIPQLDLVVVNDIKSSIFAVKDRAESLQLHGYGLSYAKAKKRSRYLTAIWDASDGKHYVNDRIIELDSFEFAEISERIRLAANNNSDKYTKGTHCSSCWKRDSCPAHLVDLGDENRFAKLFSGQATERDVREALVAVKGLGELANKVTDFCKDWASRHGGIRSEDGLKVFKPMMRGGRKSLDQELVCKELGLDSLDKFMKKGNDYVAFDWSLIKGE